jgi:CSLREA domain-containing protein
MLIGIQELLRRLKMNSYRPYLTFVIVFSLLDLFSSPTHMQTRRNATTGFMRGGIVSLDVHSISNDWFDPLRRATVRSLTGETKREPLAGITFTVNSTADPGSGSCDATECTLREAITAANAAAGTDTIAFNIPAAGLQTIRPTSVLPAITSPVIIDGYTQPGASPNTLANSGKRGYLLQELKSTPRA